MKMYYLLLDTNVKPLTTPVSTYWAGDNTKVTFLLQTGNLILPLGNKKPKNVSRETIKTF